MLLLQAGLPTVTGVGQPFTSIQQYRGRVPFAQGLDLDSKSMTSRTIQTHHAVTFSASWPGTMRFCALLEVYCSCCNSRGFGGPQASPDATSCCMWHWSRAVVELETHCYYQIEMHMAMHRLHCCFRQHPMTLITSKWRT